MSKNWLTKAAEFIGETAASISNDVTKAYDYSTEAITEALKAGTEAFEKNHSQNQPKEEVTQRPATRVSHQLCTWGACNKQASAGYELCPEHLNHFSASNRDAWRSGKPYRAMCTRHGCTAEVLRGEVYCEEHLFEMQAFERTAALAKEHMQAAEARRLATLCCWKNCSYDRLGESSYCALHQREHDQLKSRRCGLKLRHASLEDALKEAEQMRTKSGDRFNAYHCNFCNHYHIGHSRRDYRDF